MQAPCGDGFSRQESLEERGWRKRDIIFTPQRRWPVSLLSPAALISASGTAPCPHAADVSLDHTPEQQTVLRSEGQSGAQQSGLRYRPTRRRARSAANGRRRSAPWLGELMGSDRLRTRWQSLIQSCAFTYNKKLARQATLCMYTMDERRIVSLSLSLLLARGSVWRD